MKVIVAFLFFMVGNVAPTLFFCNTPSSDPFMMTAQAKSIFEGWSGKTLKVWGATNRQGATCIDLVFDYAAKTYKVYSMDSDNTAQATSGTFTYSRSRSTTTIKFKQTSETDTGLFHVKKDSEWTYYIAYLTTTDMVLATCGTHWFVAWYDQWVLSTEDLSPVTSTCFSAAMKRSVGYSTPMLARSNCTAR